MNPQTQEPPAQDFEATRIAYLIADCRAQEWNYWAEREKAERGENARYRECLEFAAHFEKRAADLEAELKKMEKPQ